MMMTALATFAAAMLHQAQAPRSSGPHHIYVLAGPLLTVQRAGPVLLRTGPALSGKGVGFAIAGGYFLTPRLALEGELNVGGDISAAQRFDDIEILSNDYIRHNRDITVTGQVRVSTGMVDVVLGAGSGFTRVGKTNSTTTTLGINGVTVAHDDDYWYVNKGAMLTYGIDVPIPSHSRVQIVPTFRGHIMRRPDSADDEVGASAYVFQFGVAMRFGAGARTTATARGPRTP